MSKSEVKIEITRDADGNTQATMQGTSIGILSGLLGGVNQIYKTLPEGFRGPFRDTVITAVTRFDSPVWDTTDSGEGTRMFFPMKERDGE